MYLVSLSCYYRLTEDTAIMSMTVSEDGRYILLNCANQVRHVLYAKVPAAYLYVYLHVCLSLCLSVCLCACLSGYLACLLASSG